MSGVYSDEVFKEQNAFIEEQIFKAQIAKQDETFEKYDINKITDFMKTLLADLSEAYKKSEINQKRALLGSIFPAGVTWRYPGLSNQEIGLIYSSIRTAETLSVPLGDPTGVHIPRLEKIFQKVMYFQKYIFSITYSLKDVKRNVNSHTQLHMYGIATLTV